MAAFTLKTQIHLVPAKAAELDPKPYRISWTIGTGLDKNNEVISTMRGARLTNELKEAASLAFGGATVTKVSGGWFNPQGTYVTEDSIVLAVVIDAGSGEWETVEAFAKYARDKFNQGSVLEVVERLESKRFV